MTPILALARSPLRRFPIWTLGCLLLAMPPAARAGTGDAVGGGVAIGALIGAVCWTGVLGGDDDDLSETERKYARRGFRVGVSGAAGIDLFESNLEQEAQRDLKIPVNASVEESGGVVARGGYRCQKYFGAEAQVEWQSGFESNLRSKAVVGRVATVDLEPIVVTSNIRVYPLSGRFQPYVLAGAGGITVEQKVRDKSGLAQHDTQREADFAMRFGFGLDVYATRNVVVTVGADYVRPFGNLHELDYVSTQAGFEYRF